ncbi:MAG: Ca2+-dependent phosphoinositide-specific phospholipase C [Bacteroidia bacterium]
MKKQLLSIICFSLFLSCYAQNELDSLQINEFQVIASHNSYRLRTNAAIYRWTRFFHIFIPKQYNTRAWDYSHLPLEEQFEKYHVRGIELDLYYDPQGGRYAKRKGNWLVFQSAKSRVPALEKPGFKIIHIPDIDYNTHYFTFVQALTALKKWSDTHPQHSPIFVNIELKSAALGDHLPLKSLPKAVPFTPQAGDSLDAEIKSVFGEDLRQIITPDKLRGEEASLNEVVKKGLLPTLAQTRGKIFFIIDGNATAYLIGHPTAHGRIMFNYAEPDKPEAVFLIANDALKDKEKIQQWVKQGYLVRTRCDSDTEEARTGDTRSREAALESGAQILSTDYYRADERGKTQPKKWSNYKVEIGGEVRKRGGQ